MATISGIDIDYYGNGREGVILGEYNEVVSVGYCIDQSGVYSLHSRRVRLTWRGATSPTLLLPLTNLLGVLEEALFYAERNGQKRSTVWFSRAYKVAH